MTRIISTRGASSNTLPAGVSGLRATPAESLRSRSQRRHSRGSLRLSMWKVMWSAPARANGSRNRSGSVIMRWTSRGSRVTRRSAFTTAGPRVRFGTKCPSMMSTWIWSAPAASTRRTSSPRRVKSAARTEGAILRVCAMDAGDSRGDSAAVKGPGRRAGGSRDSTVHSRQPRAGAVVLRRLPSSPCLRGEHPSDRRQSTCLRGERPPVGPAAGTQQKREAVRRPLPSRLAPAMGPETSPGGDLRTPTNQWGRYPDQPRPPGRTGSRRSDRRRSADRRSCPRSADPRCRSTCSRWGWRRRSCTRTSRHRRGPCRCSPGRPGRRARGHTPGSASGTAR